MKQYPEVLRIALIGSVARPLVKEVPRFSDFRRYGKEVWHECHDLDLAVWITKCDELNSLRHTVVQGLKKLLEKTGIGVASHEVDVFFFKSGTDRFQGLLCYYNQCPKGKINCDVPGCGDKPFLKQVEDFHAYQDILDGVEHKILFDRETESITD